MRVQPIRPQLPGWCRGRSTGVLWGIPPGGGLAAPPRAGLGRCPPRRAAPLGSPAPPVGAAPAATRAGCGAVRSGEEGGEGAAAPGGGRVSAPALPPRPLRGEWGARRGAKRVGACPATSPVSALVLRGGGFAGLCGAWCSPLAPVGGSPPPVPTCFIPPPRHGARGASSPGVGGCHPHCPGGSISWGLEGTSHNFGTGVLPLPTGGSVGCYPRDL